VNARSRARACALSQLVRVAFLASCVVACSRGEPAAPAANGSPTTAATAAASASNAALAPVVAIDALGGAGDCTFGHRGVLLDFGDVATRSRLAPTERSGRIDSVERDGATWARVFARGVSLPFVASADDVASVSADGATPVIEARVRGGSAKSIAVFLNGKAAGVWPLAKGEARVVSLAFVPNAPNGPQLVAGTNEILLRFHGAARAGASAPDEEAEVDWIHVGGAIEGETYAAPTRADAITSVTLAGVPMRAVSLRAPGYARCTGWLPSNGHLVASVGVAGTGDADVELRALRDRAPPVVLASLHLTGDAAWTALDLPLVAHAPAPLAGKGTLGAIELVAVRSTHGARVVFGEPRVVSAPAAAASAPAPPPVTGVVLVVLGSIAPRSIDLYAAAASANGSAPATPMPELDALARTGVTFDANRATSGAASGALASILTALPARAHGVIDDESGLSPTVTTLADVARQAGIRAAMFTANPTTGSAFGFARGWDKFIEHPPGLDEAPGSATAPFDDASRWIADHAAPDTRFLVVIHARGGHPPWDATPEDLRTLTPPDYTGAIDPRRAAELLVRARAPNFGTPHAPMLHLTDSDRARAWSLYALALRTHDAALGRLLAALKAAGRDDGTLVIVTGDVGLGDARAPLEATDALDESALTTPLVVRFPASHAATAHVTAPTTSVDLARTIVTAFGLVPPAAFEGQDLARVARGTPGADLDPRGRPMLASFGSRFSLRWGSFVVRGSGPTEDTPPDIAKLCDLSLEPACTSDVRGAFPLALSALRREITAETKPPTAATPVIETPALRSALRLWGL
jgi:arylsulfatase A-like enzyme